MKILNQEFTATNTVTKGMITRAYTPEIKQENTVTMAIFQRSPPFPNHQFEYPAAQKGEDFAMDIWHTFFEGSKLMFVHGVKLMRMYILYVGIMLIL